MKNLLAIVLVGGLVSNGLMMLGCEEDSGEGEAEAEAESESEAEGEAAPITVADQVADPLNEVVIAEVISVGPGFLVIHEDDGAGGFGAVIGAAPVSDGANSDVTVTLDRDIVDGETLHAMLHIDAVDDGGSRTIRAKIFRQSMIWPRLS